MNHSITVADVQRIFAEEQAFVVKSRFGQKRKTPLEVRQGTRTRVHELLQQQISCPFVLPPPSRDFEPWEIEERIEDLQRRKAELRKSIPTALKIESEDARTGDPSDHQDAIHYAQKRWGQSLWVETDQLVARAESAPGGLGGLEGIAGESVPPVKPLARVALDDHDFSGLAVDASGAAALAPLDLDPFAPLAELVGKVWSTAREAMQDIARALGGPLFSWSNSGETSMWDLVFQNTNFAQAPVLQGSATAGSFYISLHTASPGQTGNQTTSEAAYTSYARVAVARTTGGWTISGNNPITASNTAAITFPAATGGSETETYFAFGSLASGAGVIYGYGALTSSLAVSNGITPSFAIGAAQCTFS